MTYIRPSLADDCSTKMPEDADTLAAALIADVGHLDAIDWLEDELAETKCQRAAAMLCNIIDAVEAQSRGRLH